VYVGSNDKNIYAITSAGSLKWKFPTNSDVRSSPVLGADGTVYVGSDDGNIYAITTG
jgi:outer membrane protein assembly factor BamB